MKYQSPSILQIIKSEVVTSSPFFDLRLKPNTPSWVLIDAQKMVSTAVTTLNDNVIGGITPESIERHIAHSAMTGMVGYLKQAFRDMSGLTS